MIFKRSDLIPYVCAEAEITKDQAEKAVDALFEVLKYILKSKQKVCFANFGTFVVRENPGHMAINIKTGESHFIGQFKRVSFKASKEFKNILNDREIDRFDKDKIKLKNN